MKFLERELDNILINEDEINLIPDRLVPVDISAIAQWARKEGKSSFNELPSMVSPWRDAWYEYHIDGFATGIRLVQERIPDDAGQEALLENWLFDWSIEVLNEKTGFELDTNSAPDKMKPHVIQAVMDGDMHAKWMCCAILYVQKDGVFTNPASISYFLDESGKMMEEPAVLHMLDVAEILADDQSLATWIREQNSINPAPDFVDTKAYHIGRIHKITSDIMHRSMYPMAFAISLLNCRNVETEVHAVPEKVRKNRRKKGKFEGIDYRTLQIHSMQQMKKAANSIKTKSQQAETPLSLRRGHWKDYRSGKGLFGKYPGLYWFDEHDVGNEKFGHISKDYQINK